MFESDYLGVGLIFCCQGGMLDGMNKDTKFMIGFILFLLLAPMFFYFVLDLFGLLEAPK